MPLQQNYNSIKTLFESFHELRQGNDEPPDSRMVSGVLFCITNEHLIKLLQFLLVDQTAFEESRALSKKSSLFDKLILIKGSTPKPWILRLHTYQVPFMRLYNSGQSNISGETLRDDEENTHFHRWQLGSRFLTGGFNNVTWDVNDRGFEEDRQIRFGIPATSRAGTSGVRTAQNLGNAFVTQRRSDFYIAGDVISYPIVDAHSVGSSLSPFVGTTMTFAHTGREQLDDSSFFKKPQHAQINSVQQLSFDRIDFINAIHKAITRLQLIELTKQLANKNRNTAFSHMNSFETELLPRIAELFVMYNSDPFRILWSFVTWERKARQVELDKESLLLIADMDSIALSALIIDSQMHLWVKDFVTDLDTLIQHFREYQALTSRLRTGNIPQNARRY